MAVWRQLDGPPRIGDLIAMHGTHWSIKEIRGDLDRGGAHLYGPLGLYLGFYRTRTVHEVELPKDRIEMTEKGIKRS